MRRLIHTIILLCFLLPAVAQDNTSLQLYEEAESEYNIGRIDQAITLLTENLGKFKGNVKQSAYRLLSLCHLGNDNNLEAERYAVMLLGEDPYYSASPRDPQRFADLVNSIKAGLTATITTASSQAENLEEVPVPATLITEDMIKRCGGRNLQEILATYVPGMTIIDCNEDMNIAMRGIYSLSQEKILIMLNGHRMNSYCTNSAAPDFSISLEKIKQIEVLRGPASSLYGGVALTAVVNIITKQGADVDGIKLKAGIGNYGQYRVDALFGKRYFDLDVMVWASMYGASGEKVFYKSEGLSKLLNIRDDDITIGKVGPKPTYDVGVQMNWNHLNVMYNTQFSQFTPPLSMNYFSVPYTYDKYKTFNGLRPGFASQSHHAKISYSQQIKNVHLNVTGTYDNNDLTHYQVLSDSVVPALKYFLGLNTDNPIVKFIENQPGLSRFINGQEQTISLQLKGDYNFIKKDHVNSLLTFGMEYIHFRLEDARYVLTNNFVNSMPEDYRFSELARGNENQFNAFAQLKHKWKSFIVNLGLRYDYKRRYDSENISELSPRLALIYVRPKWNARLSYSKSFTDAPFLYRKTNDVLMAMSATQSSSTRTMEPLTRETQHSFQASFGGTQWVKGLNFELNLFYNRARDLIFTEVLKHVNAGSCNTYGLELMANYERPKWGINLSSEWQKASGVTTLGVQTKKPFNIPEFSANAVVTWKPVKNLRLNAHLCFESSVLTYQVDMLRHVFIQAMEQAIKDETDPTIKESLIETVKELEKQPIVEMGDLPAHLLVNIGGQYTIGNLELGLNIRNLFNTKYSRSGMSSGIIQQQGRWFMFEVAYKF